MRTSRTRDLDPETQFHQIYRDLSYYEFPFDLMQSISFALFRTFAVPSIGNLLDRTREFTDRPQQRYDDTALLLDVPLAEGFDSPDGRAALRRINQMHKMYDIAGDDMRYVLSTFVVVPVRWIEAYGWRRLTDSELLASVRYYQELGRRLGVRDIPATYDEFAGLMDDYEAAHFGHDPGARRVADATLDLLAGFQPRPLRGLTRAVGIALMDAPLRTALGYDPPHPVVEWAAVLGLKSRARLVRLLPPRRRPKLLPDLPRIRSYPDGFDPAAMGTFTPGCPVPHARRARTTPARPGQPPRP